MRVGAIRLRPATIEPTAPLGERGYTHKRGGGSPVTAKALREQIYSFNYAT